MYVQCMYIYVHKCTCAFMECLVMAVMYIAHALLL